MGYKVDDQQVVDMSKLHSNKFIAGRLGISVRQVSRILKKHDASKVEPEKRCKTIDQEFEESVMRVFKDGFYMSYQEVGRHFGLSRQAVHQRLNNN